MCVRMCRGLILRSAPAVPVAEAAVEAVAAVDEAVVAGPIRAEAEGSKFREFMRRFGLWGMKS